MYIHVYSCIYVFIFAYIYIAYLYGTKTDITL